MFTFVLHTVPILWQWLLQISLLNDLQSIVLSVDGIRMSQLRPR